MARPDSYEQPEDDDWIRYTGHHRPRGAGVVVVWAVGVLVFWLIIAGLLLWLL